MSSTSTPSSPQMSHLFPFARLQVLHVDDVSSRVVLAMAHRIYWINLDDDNDLYPTSLHDFRDAHSLELSSRKLDSWSDVVNVIKVEDAEGPSIVVPGVFHGRDGSGGVVGEVEIRLTATSVEERNMWMHEFHLRIASHMVLGQISRHPLPHADVSLSTKDIILQFNALPVGHNRSNPTAESSVQGVSEQRDVPMDTKVDNRVQKPPWTEKLKLHFTNFSNLLAKATTPEADSGMSSAGLTSAFHMVLLSARLASMFAASDCGYSELPQLLLKIFDLLDRIMESVVPLPKLTPTRANYLWVRISFKKLQEIFILMGIIEQKIMHSWQNGVRDARFVEAMESRLLRVENHLEQDVSEFAGRCIDAGKQDQNSHRERGIVELELRAEAFYRKALALHYSVEGEDVVNHNVAIALNNLGLLLARKGNLVEAEELLRKCLSVEHSIYGDEAAKSRVPLILNNIGRLRRLQEKWDEAEEFHRKALAMLHSVHDEGKEHGEIAGTLYYLSRALIAQKKTGEAGSLLRKSLELFDLIHGRIVAANDIVGSLNFLGHVLSGQEKFTDAESIHRKALLMEYSIRGEKAVHSDMASTLTNLGLSCEAQALLRKSLAKKYSIHGADAVDDDIAASLKNVGKVLKNQKKFVEAEHWYQRSLEMHHSMHGEEA